MHSGIVNTLPMLSKQLNIGFDSIEQILEKLAQINMVSKLADNDWVMIRDAEHVHVGELYRLFIFDQTTLDEQHNDAEIRAWLARLGQCHADMTDISLRDLFSEKGEQNDHPLVSLK